MVLANEVGGRWSEESRAPRAMRSRVRIAWLFRWARCWLAVELVRSPSLLERHGGLEEDGPMLASHEVEWGSQVCIVGPFDHHLS